VIRSFLSIEIPKAVKLELSAVQNKLKKIKGIRWVLPDNIHLTLKFFGDINQEQVDDIKNIISSVCLNIRPMTLKIGGFGGFPDMDKPRILWAGLDGEIKRLCKFQTLIDKSGTWYSYNSERLGQGRENSKAYLQEHPEMMLDIESRIKEKLGVLQEQNSEEEKE